MRHCEKKAGNQVGTCKMADYAKKFHYPIKEKQ